MAAAAASATAAAVAPTMSGTTAPNVTLRAPTESGSAAGATSRTHTLSNADSFDGGDLGATDKTLMLDHGGFDAAEGEAANFRDMLDRLETLQFEQRSPQQPNPELDRLIQHTVNNRPEWRQHLAVHTRSPWLRKKILKMQPAGVRTIGSSTMGHSYPWRLDKCPDEFGDHNWPKVAVNERGDLHLPGGVEKHYRLLRAPVDKVRLDPLVTHSENYSFPRNKRFWGTHPNGELNKAEVQKRGTPGPGSYFKSAPRGTAFEADSGETVVFGANHICPWKGALGHNINPVGCDHTVLTAPPKFSFPKARRSASETMSGHGLQDGGPVKTDLGVIGPGPIYEHYSSFRANGGRALSLKPKRYRSTPAIKAILKVRCVPAELPPEEPPDNEGIVRSTTPGIAFAGQAKSRQSHSHRK